MFAPPPPDLPTPGSPVLDPTAVCDDELIERTLALEALRTRIDTEEAAILAEIEVRDVTVRQFGHPVTAWLACDAQLPITVVKNRVVVGRKLRSLLPLVADALAAGQIGWDHARVLCDLANPRIGHVIAANQTMLLGLADRCRFEQWRGDVQALARLWDEDGGYDPREDPAANRLSFGSTIDGLTSLVGTLTGESGEVVTQAINAKADELFRAAVAEHERVPELEIPSAGQLRADALVELVRQALGVDLDSTKGPKVEATLVVPASDPTTASDPDGVPLADGTTRVLGCDAELHALIVDSLGVPLDLGDGARFASDGQRRAVRNRDGGCAFTGCNAKVMWCDVHHCIHWKNNGVTDLCNLICLCRRHHGVIHRNGWDVRLDTDGWPIFKTPTGRLFWGQRHGRQREGPPPDPAHVNADPNPPGGTQVIPGRDRNDKHIRLVPTGPDAA